MQAHDEQPVTVHTARVALPGTLEVPGDPSGIVVFAHGSGSSHDSPRNHAVAELLVGAGFATLLFDLLTHEEEVAERYTHHLRFDIELLATRLAGALQWVQRQDGLASLPIGLFGASTGAAAALITAARVSGIGAVVSRGGRPDLAGDALADVVAPTLLIVGGADLEVLELNRRAMRRMTTETRLHVVPGATHLFEEPGALREVADLAAMWFLTHLPTARWLQEHGADA
jgi:dienelactone hydrolase